MKKFSTLAISALLALGASATGAKTLRTNLDLSAKSAQAELTAKQIGLDKLPQDKLAKLQSAAKAKRATAAKAATAAADISGDYTFTLGDIYFGTNSAGIIDEDGTIAVEDGVAVISSEYFMTDVFALYDEATSTISFLSLPLGGVELQDGSTVYMKFEPTAWSEDAGVYVEEYSVTFNAETGTITFPADHGFSWKPYTDEEYTVPMSSYFDLFDVISMVKVNPNADPNEGWTSLGNALMSDGWGLPLIDIDQTDEENWVEVELQQNNENGNLYRLVNPYQGSHPLAEYNTCTKNGYIEFDVTDPEHVVFSPVEAGLTVDAAGVSKFYCMNTLTSIMGYYQTDAATIIGIFGNEIPYTTFKEGILTLGSSLEPVATEEYAAEDGTGEGDAEPEMEWVSDACFGIQGDIYAGYGWTDNSGKSANMATTIYFPGAHDKDGVANVNIADAKAPVKYFNLQGMPVAAPAKGQVVIRVQGDKAQKTLVK